MEEGFDVVPMNDLTDASEEENVRAAGEAPVVAHAAMWVESE